jgi:cation transport ATPase
LPQRVAVRQRRSDQREVGIAGAPPDHLVGPRDVRVAAAADQASQHPMARAIVAAAHARGLALPVPTEITEVPGEGLTARVDSHLMSVGGTGFVRGRIEAPATANRPARVGSAVVAVAIDGRFAGDLVLADTLRPETAGFIAGIRRFGVHRILLATGDRADVRQ